MNAIRKDLERFYDLLSQLESSSYQGMKLKEYSGKTPLSSRGVYFFREPDEFRLSQTDSLRIVRVGTHALKVNSKTTLWKRLRSHLGTKYGGGNHRGSVFRLHIGAAMIARDGAAVPTWGKGASAPLELRLNKDAQELEAHYERTVSNYIGEMTVLWVNISDDAGPSSSRAYIERNAIALLSNKLSPLDPSSNSWLGRYSPREGVRLSSLWNLNHINEKYDPLFLNEFANIVNSTIA